MIYDKICVAPHQIVDEDLDIQEVGHNGAEYYLRANKVMEILEAHKEEFRLNYLCYNRLMQEIETLKSE